MDKCFEHCLVQNVYYSKKFNLANSSHFTGVKGRDGTMPYHPHYFQFMAINFRTCPQTTIMLLREAIDTASNRAIAHGLHLSKVLFHTGFFSWGVHDDV